MKNIVTLETLKDDVAKLQTSIETLIVLLEVMYRLPNSTPSASSSESQSLK